MWAQSVDALLRVCPSQPDFDCTSCGNHSSCYTRGNRGSGAIDNPMGKQQRSVSSWSPQNVASYSFNMHATQPRMTSDSTLLPLSPESWDDGCVPPFLGFGFQIREVG